MHWWNGDGHMGWTGTWWIIGAALVAVVVWALLRFSRGPANGSSESPGQVLRRRYAKGEIDQATYQRMVTELEG